MAECTAKENTPWLSIVGIGEDGADGLGVNAIAAIENAEIIFGAPRQLELASSKIHGEARTWPSPFDTALAGLIALRGKHVCVLASGDPFWNGVGATISRQLQPGEYAVYPAPSSFSHAAARLGWPIQSVDTISLHGRPIQRLRPLLQPGNRILALTSDGEAPSAIADQLRRWGFGATVVHVLEALGGPSEARSTFSAIGFPERRFNPLNVLALEVAADAASENISLAASVPDSMFETDGQITKADIRAMTIAALAPMRGQILWDVGAGSGSIAITWMLGHPSLRAIAIEADAARAERVARNAAFLGAPDLKVVAAAAPDAYKNLERPHAIFVGGGGSEPGVIDGAIEALRPGGRLVANAVTLEMEAVLLALQQRLGGSLSRVSIQRAEPIGSMLGWRPAMPITRWVWVKAP